MKRDRLLREVASALEDVYGPRLRGVVLYGSEARQVAEPDSDIDILVLLQGPIQLWQDIRTITEALYPLQLQLERPLSAIPADAEAYEAQNRLFYRNARRDGIRV
jgi:hypothetical protein